MSAQQQDLGENPLVALTVVRGDNVTVLGTMKPLADHGKIIIAIDVEAGRAEAVEEGGAVADLEFYGRLVPSENGLFFQAARAPIELVWHKLPGRTWAPTTDGMKVESGTLLALAELDGFDAEKETRQLLVGVWFYRNDGSVTGKPYFLEAPDPLPENLANALCACELGLHARVPLDDLAALRRYELIAPNPSGPRLTRTGLLELAKARATERWSLSEPKGGGAPLGAERCPCCGSLVGHYVDCLMMHKTTVAPPPTKSPPSRVAVLRQALDRACMLIEDHKDGGDPSAATSSRLREIVHEAIRADDQLRKWVDKGAHEEVAVEWLRAARQETRTHQDQRLFKQAIAMIRDIVRGEGPGLVAPGYLADELRSVASRSSAHSYIAVAAALLGNVHATGSLRKSNDFALAAADLLEKLVVEGSAADVQADAIHMLRDIQQRKSVSPERAGAIADRLAELSPADGQSFVTEEGVLLMPETALSRLSVPKGGMGVVCLDAHDKHWPRGVLVVPMTDWEDEMEEVGSE